MKPSKAWVPIHFRITAEEAAAVERSREAMPVKPKAVEWWRAAMRLFLTRNSRAKEA